MGYCSDYAYNVYQIWEILDKLFERKWGGGSEEQQQQQQQQQQQLVLNSCQNRVHVIVTFPWKTNAYRCFGSCLPSHFFILIFFAKILRY